MSPEQACLFRWAEARAREVFDLFEFSEIRTPLLEETEVFTRSIGEDTDIVEKEMYSFPDRGGKNISLRPEGTASIIRAYIEHGWNASQDIVKLYYMGPMFRGERPQKGRLRQFHQIGAEMIGASNPYIDAELILNLEAVLKNIEVEGFRIVLNSLGCVEDRTAYKKKLSDFLKSRGADLCEDCRRRSSVNVLRVLDCKKEVCISVVKDAPSIMDHLCEKCADDYGTLKTVLEDMAVSYEENDRMVRGLDYYTGSVFEVRHPGLGAQDALAAGGRYDNLTRDMGGPDVGATGYAIGVERMLMVVNEDKVPASSHGVLVIALDEACRLEAIKLTQRLRSREIKCDMDHSGRSLKGGMRKANREGRKKVIILGEDEVKSGKFMLKDMESGEQKALSFEEAVKVLAESRQI